MFSTFPQVQSYLDSLVNFEHDFPVGGMRDRPKLQPTLDAIERLGLSRRLGKCAHIAGTVGKGSVATYLNALCGLRGGSLMFTSPHLNSVKERIQLNAQEVPDELWCEGFSAIVVELRKPPEIKLTYFESCWIFYLWLSSKLGVEFHVVETGLGGKWDATNVLDESVAVLTKIDLDHVGVLGNSIAEIAQDKCGIIKQGALVVSAPQEESALQVIEAECKRKNATWYCADRDFSFRRESEGSVFENAEWRIDSLTLSTPGQFQRENAAVAMQAAWLLNALADNESIRETLRYTGVRARQQLLIGKPMVMVDVAHNPAAFEKLAESLWREFGRVRITAVVGMMKDKDVRASLSHLKRVHVRILAVPTGNPRSMPPEKLAEIAVSLGFEAEACASQAEGFEKLHASPDTVVAAVTGSFYVAGAYLNWRRDAGIA